MTPHDRYEIGRMADDPGEVEEFAQTRLEAFDHAKQSSASDGKTFYVFDRMAWKGRACRWDFRNGVCVNTEIK
jgi:hypothetical protein